MQNFGSDLYFGDGTFMSCPQPLKHGEQVLFTLTWIQTLVTNVVPVVSALLPNKTTKTYVRLFKLIQDKLNVNIVEFKAVFASRVEKNQKK